MAQQVHVETDASVDGIESDGVIEVVADVAYMRLGIVNVVFLGLPDSGQWVLVDAGLSGTAGAIQGAAEGRFPTGAPRAIVLTHGHFDHVGALLALAKKWNVPIYAHHLEHPYLNGSQPYPPPDPSVGGGLMSTLSRYYPRGPIDASAWLKRLPADGTIPELHGWTWIESPGHTAGHISLWRESDRTLIAGDAFITTAQESAYAVLTQEPELHGPPMYYTTDWTSVRASVGRLAALEPEVVVTGHGPAMMGPAMRVALHELAERFDEIAVPAEGRYVDPPRSPK